VLCISASECLAQALDLCRNGGLSLISSSSALFASFTADRAAASESAYTAHSSSSTPTFAGSVRWELPMPTAFNFPCLSEASVKGSPRDLFVTADWRTMMQQEPADLMDQCWSSALKHPERRISLSMADQIWRGPEPTAQRLSWPRKRWHGVCM